MDNRNPYGQRPSNANRPPYYPPRRNGSDRGRPRPDDYGPRGRGRSDGRYRNPDDGRRRPYDRPPAYYGRRDYAPPGGRPYDRPYRRPDDYYGTHRPPYEPPRPYDDRRGRGSRGDYDPYIGGHSSGENSRYGYPPDGERSETYYPSYRTDERPAGITYDEPFERLAAQADTDAGFAEETADVPADYLPAPAGNVSGEEFEDEFTDVDADELSDDFGADFDDDFDDDFSGDPAYDQPLQEPSAAPAPRRVQEDFCEDDDFFGSSSSSGYSYDEDEDYYGSTRGHQPASGFYDQDYDTPSEESPCRRPAQAASAPADIPEPFNRTILLAVLGVLCVLAAYLVPSGKLLESTSILKDQHSASFDIRTGIQSLKDNTTNAILGLPKVYTLPMSHGPVDTVPDPDGYSSYVDEEGVTHDTYTDDSISIDLCKIKRTYEERQVILNVAKIKIAHPSQFRSGFAAGEYSERRVNMTKISAQYNALFSINGEYYNQPGRKNILIRHGTLYRPSQTNKETLFVDTNGNFIIKRANNAVSEGLLEREDLKIYHTFAFGPALIVDGVARSYPVDKSLVTYRNPRTAIGQLGELEYLIVVVEGRTENSAGMRVNELAQFMLDEGCTQAYNLDGGQSSELVFKGKPYNEISNGRERANADILYFASAIPEE